MLYRDKRNREDNEEVEISAFVIMVTAYAYQLDFGADQPEWFPKSQVTDNGDGTFTMPQWLAIEKGAV